MKNLLKENKHTKHTKFGYLFYFLIFLSFVTGSLLTWFIEKSGNFNFGKSNIGAIGAIRETVKDKPLIKPLLAYNFPESTEYDRFKKDIKSIIDQKVRNKEITVASVYYRNLNTGQWFGVNQDETFIPASLFKVPLMIAYLKDAERSPELLSKKIVNTLSKDTNENEIIKPLKTIIQGQSYTVDELLSYMIEYSDNNATYLLFQNINQITLKEVFDDLDINLPKENSDTGFISVNNYSLLFRVLYNATYLNHEMSEKGLEMLSKIDFKEGIRTASPRNSTIADKFGEYSLIANGKVSNQQLHDCGIVYYPDHPYILCIMTKGDSLDNLKKAIQDIAKKVNQNVEGVN